MLDKNLSINIKKRRSIFPSQFNGEIIDKETILELLQNANTAPTHKLTQPWVFKVFAGEAKNKLANELIKIHNPTSILFNEKIQTKFQLSSHIICVCMRRDESESIPEWEEISATAMAVQNIWLSCVNSKVGGYWSTPKEIEKLHTFLNLTTYERCLGLFYLGIYESIKPRNLPRKNIQKDTEWYE
tara:strand:+ start:127 stop:684 length:558 start_codon:yes stop_codon:yes gene_type:complete